MHLFIYGWANNMLTDIFVKYIFNICKYIRIHVKYTYNELSYYCCVYLASYYFA